MPLTEKTPTTVAFLLVICGTALGFLLWLNERFDLLEAKGAEANQAVRDEVGMLRDEVRELKYAASKIDEKVSDRITFSKVESALLKLARDNPTLKVPELVR